MLENDVLVKVAKKHGKTTAQVLLRFLNQKEIAVIPKSVTPDRIVENFQVFIFFISIVSIHYIRWYNHMHHQNYVPYHNINGLHVLPERFSISNWTRKTWTLYAVRTMEKMGVSYTFRWLKSRFFVFLINFELKCSGATRADILGEAVSPT